MKSQSLRFKINAAILTACIIISLIFGIVLYRYELNQRKFHFEQINILLSSVFQQKKEVLANEIFAGQKLALANTLEEIQNVKGITDLTVYSLNGNALMTTCNIYPAVLSSSEREILNSHPSFIEEISRNGQPFAEYSSVIEVIGERVGYFKMSFDLRELKNVFFLNRFFFFALFISILLASSVVITIILSRSVTRPTSMLRDAFNKVREGRLGEQVDINTGDEIGEMAAAFNDMSSRLEEQHNALSSAIEEKASYAIKLEELNVHLEDIVEERTTELKKSNEDLQREINERIQAEKEKRELEGRLARSQKMEALGLLAGGVAHDLNNVLSGIVSYPDLLLFELPEESPLRKPILTIRESGQKAADIVQDLLTLARRGVASMEVLNLNTIIADYLKSPEYENLRYYHPGVHVETRLAADLLNIKGSPIHLKKTFMNLIINAAEAQPGGGKIIISTENQYVDRQIRGYDNIVEGDFAVLRVSDKGVGIALNDLNRIFEPFYTKKIMGRSGTGLGMAVVWGTVQDHNGYIDIKSSEDTGTTFELYFPVTRDEAGKADIPLPVEAFMGNGESILVVDDILEQRELACTILSKLGYSVTAVSSGEEAVEYMKNNEADLLVLDMIMDPGIDGLDTYREIVKLHPRQRAIIASGFAESDRVKQAQKLGAGQYIKKPYTLEKIGIAVKAELKK